MTDITHQTGLADKVSANAKPARSSTSLIHDEGFRAIAFQVIILGLIAAFIGILVMNTLTNLEERNIQTGYGFMEQEAGFDINQNLVEFSPASTYGRALLVGLLNTVLVAAIGIVFATLIGTIVGIARLSTNWLVAKIATTYVEVIRNVPLLLQLFLWYGVFTTSFPRVRDAWNPIGTVYISNRGFHLPTVTWEPVFSIAAISILAAIGVWIFLSKRADKVQAETGKRPATTAIGLGLLFGLPVLIWALGGAPWEVDSPAASRFNINGGVTVTPEFMALLLGLTFYTAGFIAEVVRSGILAISKGQWEAGLAIGLSQSRVLRLIILPQALRVIVPPTTSQYLNLTKNSSLAVAIGYPDLVSTANTTMNQTGQAIEAIAIIMAAYLTVSLSISAFMNWYNTRIALVER